MAPFELPMPAIRAGERAKVSRNLRPMQQNNRQRILIHRDNDETGNALSPAETVSTIRPLCHDT